jgi:hypothetical protein
MSGEAVNDHDHDHAASVDPRVRWKIGTTAAPTNRILTRRARREGCAAAALRAPASEGAHAAFDGPDGQTVKSAARFAA